MKSVNIDDPCLDIYVKNTNGKIRMLFEQHKDRYKVDTIRELKTFMTYSSIERTIDHE